ncbi:DNA-binding transcriptional regulator, LysR family [Palleronia marisminoris]|uniref:Hydrogen peroxide-inducible genes activator n=1 Tax=Palleronia marisminoris TaxID=315423 RepID=A0A1Y5TD64_9RHOB|nr:LysR family transcriptional regulator [Palleronia marisminoris]SFH32624.1 DNA-binding transcriptional regulator, LysR family [Palleronia marisminoris]SLN61067.1 Hydrogen peroxide-inducible genes activator [Palleronia marisminoris]
MIATNLRHLRLFLAVAETRSLTRASARLHVSQPAVTQAIRKLERVSGGMLFERTGAGFFVTPRGEALAARLSRAFAILDPVLADVSPRLKLTATRAQLQALIALHETENYTLAARRLGHAQPTVHRAVAQIEREAGRRLFERTSFGMTSSRLAATVARAALLAFREFELAEADLAELDGGVAGRIVIGALPMARSVLLPRALAILHAERPQQRIRVVDGLYDELLTELRRGDLDVIVGALRDPAPIGDVVQERLFDDRLAVIAGPTHPLVDAIRLGRADLHGVPWVVPRSGTPSRVHFDAWFGENAPQNVIEAGSILLMREILAHGRHLGCISALQAQAEIAKGLVSEIDVDATWPNRPIGLAYRGSWVATRQQARLLELLRTPAS